MTYCIVENLREAPKKKKNTRSSKFNKVSGYKINILHLYILTDHYKLKLKIPFTRT